MIGAGPAGLTAAYCLTKETPSVIVIERDPAYVGGISRTVELQGLPLRHRRPPLLLQVEGGGRPLERDPARRFHRAAAAVAHLLRRQVLFLSAERVRGAAQPRHLHQRRLHAVLCLGQAVPGRGRRARFQQWVRNQFGERLFSIFFKTYTEKVWGMSCDEISADWAAQRIKGLDLRRAVIERAEALARAQAEGRAPRAATSSRR